MKKALLFIFVATVLMCESVMAVPDKPVVTGSIINGGEISIGCSDGICGFGTGPTVSLFDDFELGTDGGVLQTGAGSAQDGAWDSINNSQCSEYSASFSNSGSLSGLFAGNSSTCYSIAYVENLPEITTKVFMSYWVRISTITHGGSWKTVWIWDSGSDDDDISVPTQIQNGSWVVDGNDNTDADGIIYLTESQISANTWVRRSFYIELASTASGKFRMWETYSGGTSLWATSDELRVAPTSTGMEWRMVNIPGLAPTANIWHDDVYIAYGDNAQARIEIGDSATYANCTKLAVAVPTSWESNSITAIFYEGGFDAYETAYLYIFDADGGVSPASDPITIGVSTSSTSPRYSGVTFRGMGQ